MHWQSLLYEVLFCAVDEQCGLGFRLRHKGFNWVAL